MSQDEESRVQKGAKSLQNLTNTLSSSLSNLSSSSRSIPTERDFHFYYNFPEFILPVQDISSDSHSLLDSIGTSQIWNLPLVFPEQIDIDEAYDWLVNVNDEVYERFDMSLDEIEHDGVEKNSRGMDENGFQTVYGKKKKGEALIAGDSVSQRLKKNGGDSLVAKMKKEKGKIPFHIATIKRPQEEYNILVNNSNQPFQHVWLQRSYDDMRFIHPLEKLSVMDFVDKDVGNTEPVKPVSLEDTRFKLVEDVKDLKELAAKLRSVNEFAVDLEHNQYRSFQGLTCLMQISTRTEDFVVDTLKLRIHVGPYLREVFKDPTKKKVMHGADRDIVWLQRDFGIYLCNMFDTGQASRVLKLERNSLEHLLQHFCGVTANKEYQNADWRLRPLPEEMIRYGREDTHYLLYIYDLMKIELSKLPKESEDSDPPLVEVYKRSYDICMQLYEKDLLTENTYLHIYGLQDACLDAKQLAVVAGLCEWRDVVARAEDESTGYILPNKTLLEIAKQMPDTTSKLRRMLKSRHTYLDRNLSSVVSIVKHSVLNAAAFEEVSKYLKEKAAAEAKLAANNESEATNSSPNSKAEISTTGSLDAENESNTSPSKEEDLKLGSSITKLDGGAKSGTEKKESGTMAGVSASAKVAAVCVPALKKPSHGFGALLGAVPKRKFDTDKKVESSKLEQIRSSVTLPFQSFSPKEDKPKSTMDDAKILEAPKSDDSVAVPGGESNPDVIMLADSENEKESTQGNQEASNVPQEDNSSDKEDGEPMSLSDLSSSFQKCFDSVNQNKNPGKPEKSEDGTGFLQLKPYDFEKARKEIKFGEGPEGESAGDEGKNEGKKKSKRDSKEKKKGSDVGRLPKDDGTRELLPQGRRRQAFPASGNRSATFR